MKKVMLSKRMKNENWQHCQKEKKALGVNWVSKSRRMSRERMPRVK